MGDCGRSGMFLEVKIAEKCRKKVWRLRKSTYIAPLKLLLNGNLEDYEVGIDLKEKGEDSGSSGFSPFLFLYV